MSELIRLYAQIALLRRGPQDLPASPLLLVLTVAAFLAVNVVVSSVLPPENSWREILVLATLFTLLWYVLLLRLAGRPERTLQTTTAVFGFQTVLAPLVVGCGWLVRRFGEDSPWQLPVICAALLVLAWVIAANSYIVKAALEWSATSSVALVILETVAGWLVQVALLAPVKA
jgi:heme/copper-type cytochrome/quinol oxidase subunit 4